VRYRTLRLNFVFGFRAHNTIFQKHVDRQKKPARNAPACRPADFIAPDRIPSLANSLREKPFDLLMAAVARAANLG